MPTITTRSELARAIASIAALFMVWTAAAAPMVSAPDANGFRWCTVGAPGNAGYPRSTANTTGIDRDRIGRGSVPYTFKIAQTEISTEQWLEFMNTFAPRPLPPEVQGLPGYLTDFYGGPFWWGAGTVESNGQNRTARYALRTDTPVARQIPVWGVSWRMAAMYCNWLHNNKSSEWSALLSGAYDTSTWGLVPGTPFATDSIEVMPGAKYWIPTLDEWAKAAYYDPDRFGPGQGGWWDRPNATNDLPIPGFPGTPGAQTSTGIPLIPFIGSPVADIPLGAYPNTMSPWGLLDTIGGTEEMVSERVDTNPNQQFSLITIGASAGLSTDDPQYAAFQLEIATRAFAGGTTNFRSGEPFAGLRIASIPNAGVSYGMLLALTIPLRRNRSIQT